LITTIKSKIIQNKMVEKGQGIGYNSKYIAPKNIRISIVPIGYADFIPMKAAAKFNVYVNCTKRRILGSINMDQIVIEANLSDRAGDEVIIIGNGENCPQTIFDLAKVVKNSPVEILCHLGNRVNRVFM
jgi:alanine racemase